MRDPSPIARYALPFHRGEEPLHWWLTRLAVYPLAVWGFRFRAFGVEQVPRRGRVILAANHYSNWDPIWIAFPLPRASFFFASEGLFHHPRWGAPLRLLITAYQALPADPRRPAAALKRARRVLEAEKALVIFPEGERNFTENLLLPFQSGTALLASWTQAPVVPVYIHRGVQRGPRAWFTGEAPLAVFYGPPLAPPRKSDRETLNAWTRNLQKNVENLAREALARYPLSGEEVSVPPPSLRNGADNNPG